MRIFINDLSIPTNLSDPVQIRAILEELIKIAASAKLISNSQPVRRHRELKNKEVLPGVSLSEFILELSSSKDPLLSKISSLFLQIFAKAPFLEGFHDIEETVCDESGNCVKGTCLDDASACAVGAAIISAPASGFESVDILTIISSRFGNRKIINFNSIKKIEEMTWRYEENLKHAIPGNILINGEIHSAMTLTPAHAQHVLSNGVLIGKSIFNRVGNQWYKFHCHEKNLFHGFPVNIRTPYKEFSAAKIFLDKIGENTDGQIFSELLTAG